MIKLIATSGELSATGMSSNAREIEVTDAEAFMVTEYQALSNMLMFTLKEDGSYPEEVRTFLYDRWISIQEKLAAGPFTNKYYFRTTWSIAE